MATQQTLALPSRREARGGGALDAQMEQEIAALNDCVLAALLARLAVAEARGARPRSPA